MKKWPVLITAIAIAAVAALAIAFSLTTTQESGVPQSQPMEDGILNVQISTDKSDYRYGDKVTFRSTVENIGTTFSEYTFSSICTQGTLYVDEQPTQQATGCGDAISEVALEPGEKTTYDYEFTLVKEFTYETSVDTVEYNGELALETGEHDAYVDWQGTESKKVMFNIVD